MTATFPQTGSGSGGPETDPVAQPALAAHIAAQPAHGGDLAGAARPPTAHAHPQTDVTGLAASLAAKADVATAVLTSDGRLSDQRVPTDGSVTAAKVAAALKPSGSAAAGTEALRALGTAAATATAGNDARLSDARVFIVRDRWKPTGVKFENFSRDDCINVAGLASGQVQASGPFVLPAGASIASIGVWSGATAAVTPTNQWFALQDAATDQIVAVTADDLTAAWGANALKTLAIAGGPWVAGAETMLRGCVVVAAATPPSFFGKTGTSTAAGAFGQAPKMCGRDTTVRTGPVAVGTVLTFSTAEFRMPYFQLS